MSCRSHDIRFKSWKIKPDFDFLDAKIASGPRQNVSSNFKRQVAIGKGRITTANKFLDWKPD